MDNISKLHAKKDLNLEWQHNELDKLLDCLFMDGDWIEFILANPKTGDGKRHYFQMPTKAKTITNFARVYDQKGYNIFFGVAPRIDVKTRGIDCISLYRCHIADFDAKDFESKKEFETHMTKARKRAEELDLFPTFEIFSGKGYHWYWCLEEGDAYLSDEFWKWQEFQKRIIKTFGSDPNIKDIYPRTLRLPISINNSHLKSNSHKWPEWIKNEYPLPTTSYFRAYGQCTVIFEREDFEGLDLLDEPMEEQIERVREEGHKIENHKICEIALDAALNVLNQKSHSFDDLQEFVASMYAAKEAGIEFEDMDKLFWQYSPNYNEKQNRQMWNSAKRSKSKSTPGFFCETAKKYYPSEYEEEKRKLYTEEFKRVREEKIESAIINPQEVEKPLEQQFINGVIPLIPEPIEKKGGGKKYIEPVTMDIADIFAKVFKDNILYQNSNWYRYAPQKGIWEEETEEIFDMKLNEIVRPLDELNAYPRYRFRTKVKTIKGYIQRDGNICIDQKLNEKKDIFCLINGVYDKREHLFKKHDAKNYSTIGLPYSYDKNAKIERWEQFLQEVFPKEKYIDQESTIQRLQEWFGYCLTRETKIEKALMIIGGGSNGKSKFLDVLKGLMGKENYSAIEPENLFERFQSIGLEGKLANIASDMAKTCLSEQYKKVISGEEIICDRKGLAPIKLKPFAKHIFAMNQYPALSDRTYGFYRRFDIIEFKRTFSTEERDIDLGKKLTQELPGIFNWAIEGLQRLEKNNWVFTPSLDFIASEDEFRHTTDHILRFLDECNKLPIDADENFIQEKASTLTEVYKSYKEWCLDSLLKPLGKISFSQDLKRKGHQPSRITRKDGKRVRVFKKIALGITSTW